MSDKKSTKKPAAKKKATKKAAKSQPKKQASKKPAAKTVRSTGKMSEKKTAKAAKKSNGAQKASEKPDTIFTEDTPEGAARTVSAVLGEVIWLLSQSPTHKNFFISDLEWMVMTPVILEQYRIFYAKDRPVGVALWAKVSDHVEQRLALGNARMQPGEWRSGEKLWIVDIVAPFGGHEEMLKDMKANVFQEQIFKFLTHQDGKPVVKEM